MTIGERIKKRRKELGITVDELAEILHKNRATIYRYEKNNIEKLPADILDPLSKVLKVSAEYLMGWNENDMINGIERLEKDIEKDNNVNIKKMFFSENISIPVLSEVENGRLIFREAFSYSGTEADFCFRVRDNNMNKSGIKKNDVVFIKKDCYIKNGSLTAVIYNSEIIIGRCYCPEGRSYVITQDNNEKDPLVFSDNEAEQIKIIGTVTAILNYICAE